MATIKQKFNAREQYDDSNELFVYPELPSLYTNYYLDTWNVIPFYGKVDTLGIPVIPKKDYLRYCSYSTDSEQYLVLQPVVDFFFSLRTEYEKFYRLGSFKRDGVFYKKDLKPKNAFIDSNVQYYNIIQQRYEKFIDYLVTNNKINQIKNYEEFLNEFIVFLEIENLYFTRAGFVESHDYSLLSTGLCLDVYSEDTNNDTARQSFYEDSNTISFLELCLRNNFKVDREIPWRVFLDIRTKSNSEEDICFVPKINEFIPEFKEDLQKFFDFYYDKVIPCDENSFVYFEEFVIILQSFYKSFISSYPTYLKYTINDCKKAEVVKIERDTVFQNFYYNYEKYTELYLKFRNMELSKVIDKSELESCLDSSLVLYKNLNNTNSLVDTVTKTILFYTKKLGTLAYRYPSLYELDKK